jgi:transcription antitermination factor NusG
MAPQWFIIRVEPGQEQVLCEELMRRATDPGLGQVIVSAFTPMESGRVLYSGYIVVQLEPTDEAFQLVRSFPGIVDFGSNEPSGEVGPGDTAKSERPEPVSDEEVERIRAPRKPSERLPLVSLFWSRYGKDVN